MNRLLEIIAKNMGKIAVALVAALIVFPWVFSSAYILRIVTVCMMYVMIALSLNLLTGFLGLMTLGQAAFWGIGAYTAAILAQPAGCAAHHAPERLFSDCRYAGLLRNCPSG